MAQNKARARAAAQAAAPAKQQRGHKRLINANLEAIRRERARQIRAHLRKAKPYKMVD